MKIASTLLGSAGILLLFSFSVKATPVETVINACDNTPGCTYSTDKNGDISGCSGHACFICSGKTRDCSGVTFRQSQPVSPVTTGRVSGGLTNAQGGTATKPTLPTHTGPAPSGAARGVGRRG
jgi:hypothetical protein